MTKQGTNRELKAYCPDFGPVRQVLKNLGAAFVEVKDQEDHYYYLPPWENAEGTRRLKLRIEKGKGELVYYCDAQEDQARTSNFQLWETEDTSLRALLHSALGTKTVVRKRRELWIKDNTVFNLDYVDSIGQVLEVEVQKRPNQDAEAQLEEYQRAFKPFIGHRIYVSNEDLAEPHLAPPLWFNHTRAAG